MESPAREEERGLLSSTPVPLAGPRSWTDLSRKPKSEPYPRNGMPPPTIQRACNDTLTGPPRRPADGQQRAALRREGDGTQSRGLISPSRHMFSTAPAGLSSGAYVCTGREWTQREFPRLSVIELHLGKGLDIDAQQRALGDVAWAVAVFPSNLPGRRRGTANVSLCDHDPVSPHAAQ